MTDEWYGKTAGRRDRVKATDEWYGKTSGQRDRVEATDEWYGKTTGWIQDSDERMTVHLSFELYE